MQRKLIDELNQWIMSKNRKPLVLRGARQVGKTWLVRNFAEISGLQLIEVNFEKQPNRAELFVSNDPVQILLNLHAVFKKEIVAEKCILFLDEIQAAPDLLAKLRWFAEDMPQLAVIAAGSLLEFVLSEHSFSMPVGRINYMHVEPMSFEEFLLASDQSGLLHFLNTYEITTLIPKTIHEALLQLFREYILIGGMPAAVASWITEHSFIKVSQIHHDILTTYRDDFAKYKGRMATQRLEETMSAIPRMLGKKIIFSQINSNLQSYAIKQSLNLLKKARICHTVSASAANGVPLNAEIKEKYFKAIFLDTGLVNTLLRLDLSHLQASKDISLINQGGISEQVVGQMLRVLFPFFVEPALFYWTREEKNTNAEVDFIIQHGPMIVPIEVKSGSEGGLKSLHYFMKLKQLQQAVRIYSGLPQKTQVHVKDHEGQPIEYQLLSLPYYLLGQLLRLLKADIISATAT